MKEYRLTSWPDLPATYQQSVYRRMLCDMSHRHVTLQHLVSVSGLGKAKVREFIGMLGTRGVLAQRDHLDDSIFGTLRPIGDWIYRALTTELGARRA